MFGNNNEDLNLTITAKDDATATLNKLQKEFDELKKSLDKVSAASSGVTEEQKKATTGLGGLTASVFKGVAAWDLLKSSVDKVTGFMEESVSQFLEAQKKFDLTRSTIESTGKSFAEAKEPLEAFGKSMSALGVDNDDIQLSAAKLAKAVGGDLTQGMQLAKLAADLTASGYNDLGTNVDNLTRVLAGNGQRALMDYRINMDANATTAQQLEAIQAKVTQTTEEYANTVPGKIATARQAYTQLQQTIGGGFVAALNTAIVQSDALGNSMNTMGEITNGIGPFVFALTNFAIAAAKAFWLMGESISSVGLVVTDIIKGDMKGAFADLNVGMDKNSASLKSLGSTIDNITSPIENYDKAMKAMSESSKKAAFDGSNFASVLNSNNKVGVSADSLKDKYINLTDAFTKVRQTATDELDALRKSHSTNITESINKITDLRKSLSDLTDSYTKTSAKATEAFNKQAKDDAKNIGEQIVAQQNKIKDLQRQSAVESDPQKKQELINQLNTEQKAYNDSAEFIKSMSAEVTEAQRRDGLTEFQRQIEDYKNKRLQAQQEFDANRAEALAEYTAKTKEIALQIQQEQSKINKENELFNSKQAQITKILTTAEAIRLDVAKKSADEQIKLIDAQIAKYNALADAISRANAGKSGQVAVVAPVVKREFGGVVPGAVGTAVPIIAHGQERVIPAGKSANDSSGGSYTVVINNPSVRNDGDISVLRNQVDQAMRDLLRVHKLQTI